MIVDQGKIVGDENIANEVNSFFSSKVTRLAENIDVNDVAKALLCKT